MELFILIHNLKYVALELEMKPMDEKNYNTRALRRGNSLSQHTQTLKNNMIAENVFFMKIWYNQSDQHARILLASLGRILSIALTKIFENKKCVSID